MAASVAGSGSAGRLAGGVSGPRVGDQDEPDLPGAGVQAAGDPVEMRIRLHSWDTRLVRDVVLPTTLVKLGEADGVAGLRSAMLAELRLKLPATLRDFARRYGVRIELPARSQGFGVPERWTPAPDSPHAGEVSPGAAEISFPAGGGTAPSVHSLRDHSGRTIAEVRRAQDGEVRIIAPAAAVCWFWVRVECRVEDETLSGRADDPPRFAWRAAPNRPLPADCRQKPRAAGDPAIRIDLPLSQTSPSAVPPALALVDRVTGWAAVGELSIQRHRPIAAKPAAAATALSVAPPQS